MLAQAPALLFFVTKKLADRKPFEGLLEFAAVGGSDTCQRRRQLGPHRNFAFSFVGEIEKLIDDFRSAFLFVKLGRLERRAIPFHETVTPRHPPPGREDVISGGTVRGQEITKTG